jgi:hypothetical protein
MLPAHTANQRALALLKKRRGYAGPENCLAHTEIEKAERRGERGRERKREDKRSPRQTHRREQRYREI